MISRGDIYYADLSPVIGSEQGGIRPVLVLQNNKGNVILLEQIRTIDKVRFQEKLGTLDDCFMKKVNEAIKTSLDLK